MGVALLEQGVGKRRSWTWLRNSAPSVPPASPEGEIEAFAREAGVLVTRDAPNNFPRRPVRTDGPFLVWLGILENAESWWIGSVSWRGAPRRRSRPPDCSGERRSS